MGWMELFNELGTLEILFKKILSRFANQQAEMRFFLAGLLLFLPTITGMALFYGGGPSEFLHMVNPNAMQQFYEICQIANQSKSDVLSQLQSWAQTNGVSVCVASMSGLSCKLVISSHRANLPMSRQRWCSASKTCNRWQMAI